MPTYEFRCEAGHTFDRFLKMSEAPFELSCVECGKSATRQMSGGAGLVFKGSGFYLTDYGRAGQKPPASEGATVGGSTEKSTGGESMTSESKTSDSKSSKPDSAASTGSADKGSSGKSDKGSSAKADKGSSGKTPKSSE